MANVGNRVGSPAPLSQRKDLSPVVLTVFLSPSLGEIRSVLSKSAALPIDHPTAVPEWPGTKLGHHVRGYNPLTSLRGMKSSDVSAAVEVLAATHLLMLPLRLR